MPLDPVQLALVQSRLDHVCQQMGWIMMRTARSPIFSLAHDFSCFITNGTGYLLSQADGLPIHTGGGGFAVRALLKAFGEDIGKLDAFVLSDPYAAGGNHLPDWVIARPVFSGGRLVAFSCNRAHQSDIGGGAAGTYNSAATEIFHEGIRLPPLRLVENGEVRDDLWRLLLLNSRTPELMNGDLHAMLGSTRIGANQIAGLVESIGMERAEQYFEGILDLGDRRMRVEIDALPDGTYTGEDKTNNDCFEAGDHYVRVAIKIDGDRMAVDFTGTDPQVRGFKNSSIANTHSAVYVGLASFLNPELPGNEGTFRAVEVIAPLGTMVNARPPAPTTMNTLVPGTEIIHSIWRALGKADPQRNCAGWGKGAVPTMSGTDANGETFVMYHWAAGAGAGAVDGRDGFNAMSGLVALGALHLPDIELSEQKYPVRFLRQEFRTDSAGAGRFRGGTGIDYAVEVETSAVLALRGEGLRTRSGFGVSGGGPGAEAQLKITQLDGTEIGAPQYGILPVEPMVLEIKGAAGGGLGEPLSRDPELVLRDVRDGIISRAAARKSYGVALTRNGRRVDAEATAAQRAARRQDFKKRHARKKTAF